MNALVLLSAALAASLAPAAHGAFVPAAATFSGGCAFANMGVRLNSRTTAASAAAPMSAATTLRMSSEFADFAYDDPDDLEPIDTQTYADENDSSEHKASIGSSLEAPEVDWVGDPILVPQGSVLPLTVENVQGVLAACREEIGTMFGYSAENRGVGITGGVDFVDLDGPSVVVHLKGRFWHQRTTVLDRVGSYIIGRIPEVIDVYVADDWELTDEANNEAL